MKLHAMVSEKKQVIINIYDERNNLAAYVCPYGGGIEPDVLFSIINSINNPSNIDGSKRREVQKAARLIWEVLA